MTSRRLAILVMLTLVPAVRADDKPLPRIPTTALVLPSVSRGGRAPVIVDALEAQRLDGTPAEVNEGDEVKLADGTSRKWVKVTADKEGTFKHAALRGGYLRLEVESAEDKVMILHGGGYLYASVNGEPRVGDPYGTGWLMTPVLMKKGKNEILIQNRGDSIKPELKAPPGEVFLTDVDMTLPDVVRAGETALRAGLRVINASPRPQRGLSFVAKAGAGLMTTMIPELPPLSQTKLPCDILVPDRIGSDTKSLEVSVELWGEDNRVMTPKPLVLKLDVRQRDEKYRRTFESQIDGSVQYYSVVPAKPMANEKVGLTLTLHGAGVEAQGQAACFTPKSWTHVVAATNRRPFGFDWEDWGRLDALEVIKDAEIYLKPDPQRRWLTGHSMGGHGTWHLGVTFPDKFAAIGPSAGWVSFFSYAGGRRNDSADPIAAMLNRAMSPSDTLPLITNLKSDGVFVLHGDKDDNVPVGQARTMRQELAKFHGDWVYYERPGAGHWWGNECVDWKPMFEFFNEHTIAGLKDVRRVEFATASPGVSAHCHWATIDAQVKPFELSTIKIDQDLEKRSFSGKTTNVARLALNVAHLGREKPISIELDGQKLADVPYPSNANTVWLEMQKDRWVVTDAPPASAKVAKRYGSFKDAFRNGVVFVYGTKGTPEENAWALTKARFDAETFWYRGNGAIPAMADIDFEGDKYRGRNVVLYGNADTNAAWSSLLRESPIQVKRGSLKVGDRELKGDDLAALFVRPRPGTDAASVGVVTGTGLRGLRTTNRLPYFVSGVGIPDVMILDSSMLQKGAAGIRAAGYFGNDWSVEKGDVAWR